MGFEESGSKIYGKMQLAGDMYKLAKSDVVAALSPFSRAGFVWRNGSLVKDAVKVSDYYGTPWCHAGHLAGKHCALDNQCTFNFYNIVHPRCMSCWKTVVTPKNFDELMTWYKVQNSEEMPFACKCGIELRDYTPKFYGAYHYAPSLEEGREQLAKCKELSKKYLSEETTEGIILKRACTEFELEKGPSNAWYLTEEQEEMLDMIETYVAFPMLNHVQNKKIGHPHVQMRWLLFAHMNNDMSYLPYNDGHPLFPGYVKYNDGDINAIKHDMAILTAQAKYGHNPDMTDDFLKSITNYSKANKIPVDEIGASLGYDKLPNLGKTNYIDLYDVDPITIGEDDVLPEQK